MSSDRTRADEARRKARNFFAKDKDKESVALREREKTEAALAEKTARLRALRLAKEAADREATATSAGPARGKRAG